VKPIICLTIGDFNGIGPEVALRAAMHPEVRRVCTPLLVGPLNVFEHVRKGLRLRMSLAKTAFPIVNAAGIPVHDVGDGIWADIAYGRITKPAGKSAGVAVEQAVALCLKGEAHALVTAPVSKEALNLAGFTFPGQTEMIALLSRSQRFAMMLLSDKLRVGLVTAHLPIREVPPSITKQRIIEKAEVLYTTMKTQFEMRSPRLAVLGLNPHAGEHGLLGDEEQQHIAPAVEELKSKGYDVQGPFPADGFFASGSYRAFDAVLAMYHDQGLIPLKMTAFDRGVNYSAGLQVIRTSPDHGTAFDIAGKGKANPRSMIEATKLAARFARLSVSRKRPTEETHTP
jgi:4-hydroxythreonine-4-phosphate dehydrogenase